MFKEKQGGFSFFALIALLFASAIVVSAVAFNSTKTSHFNKSFGLNKTKVVENE